MPSREERRQAALSFVEPFLAEWRGRSADVHAAFRDWAVEQVLWDEGLSWEEIQDVTAIDGAGDMGIDAWYLKTDDSPAVLYLIQAKDTRPKREDLLKLRDGVVALFDPARRASANSEAKLRAAELSQFIETDLRIEFHLVTSELAARTLKDDAAAFNDEAIHLFEREVPCQFSVHDIEDLSQNIRVKHDRPIRFRFQIPKDNLFSFETASKFRTVTAAIDAKYLVDLFQTERTNLFRHNPRYYQTSKTAVNKDVLATLRSADRHNFFLYNNGLTTICDGLTVDWRGDTATVTAEDFQIVNGCQTTVTLHEAWRTGGGDPQLDGIQVLIRMIEEPSQSIARLIAQFTNSQNPMKAEDFRSNDERQLRLHAEFDKLQPRWFYENKRGIWATEYRTPRSRAAYRDEDGFTRHLQLKDLGQACLAFLGSPSDAIERARFIFTSDEVYGRVFPRNISAPQLLLAYLIFRRADAATQQMKRQHSWAPYLRYPLVCCVSRIIHEFTGRTGETNYFPKADSQRLIDSIADWCPAIIDGALPQLIEHVLRTAEEGAGARSLVRQRDWLDEPYANIMRQIGVTLRTEAQIAQAQGVEPSTIGLRSTFPYAIKGS